MLLFVTQKSLIYSICVIFVLTTGYYFYMEKHELEFLIKETIKLGENIMSKVAADSEFEKYRNLVNQVTIETLKSHREEIKIKTCQVILEIKPEDLRLNFWQKLIYPYFKTGTVWIPNNSIEQIHKRYILSVNANLPVLID